MFIELTYFYQLLTKQQGLSIRYYYFDILVIYNLKFRTLFYTINDFVYTINY